MRVIKLLAFTAALVISLAGISFGQEQSGSIEGVVKDQQSNVVAGATVTATGISIGFTRTANTDHNGIYAIPQVPPGTYKVTVSPIAGFGEATVTEVQVVLGKATPVNFAMQAAGATATVVVSGEDAALIDPTDNKIQTNITSQVAELLPKGTNFTSLLQ